MVLSLPSSLLVPLWAIAIALVIFLIVCTISFFILMFASQIPFVTQQIKSQMKRTAIVMMHYSNNRAKMFCPKRTGKHEQENTLSLPPSMGAKFDPSGSGLSESFDKTSMYHYYTKATTPILTKSAKGIKDFVRFCNDKGIGINKELIDVLVVENCDIQDVYTQPMLDRIMKNLPLPIRTDDEQWLDEDILDSKFHQLQAHMKELTDTNTTDFTEDVLTEYTNEVHETEEALLFIQTKHDELKRLHELKQEVKVTEDDIESMKVEKSKLIDEIDIITGYLDPDTRETIYTIKRLQDDLKQLVITEGMFVYSTVHDFAFAVSALNSSGVTESINIARSDALEQNRNDQQGLTIMTLAGLAMLGIFVIAGIGLAYKIGFGT